MKQNQTKRIVGIALFAALSFVTMLFVRFPVPPFLTLDLKDAVMTLGALFYGAWVGPLLSLLIALIELVTVSSTGFYGFLMNFLGSAVYTFFLPFAFRKARTSRAFLLGAGLSIFSMTAVMILANLVITPLYYGVTVDAVIAMIPTVLLPFNVAKGLLNALAVMILYPSTALAANKYHVATKGLPSMVFTGRDAKILVAMAIAFAAASAGLLVYLFLA